MSLFSFLLISNSAAAQVVDLDECDQSMECGDCTLYWYCEQVGEVPYYPCALWFECPSREYYIRLNGIDDEAAPCGNNQQPAVWQLIFPYGTYYPGFPFSYSWDDDPICQSVQVRIYSPLQNPNDVNTIPQGDCTFLINCF